MRENTPRRGLIPVSSVGNSLLKQDTARIHERRHIGEKPCTCKQCVEWNITTGDLRVHERSHGKERLIHVNSVGSHLLKQNIFWVYETQTTAGDVYTTCSNWHARCSDRFLNTKNPLKIPPTKENQHTAKQRTKKSFTFSSCEEKHCAIIWELTNHTRVLCTLNVNVTK